MGTAFNPQGAWTALVTPFGADGALDLEAFKRLADFQIAQGITGLVPAGTTGESPSLTWEEHNQVIGAAVEKAAGTEVGVLAGTGSNSTQEAISATKHAHEGGADAALVVDCYYNKPSSLELRTEYYQRILDAVPDIPLVPYIIPGRSVTALSAADLAILHQQNPQRIPAVKQATGDLQRMRQDRELSGASLAILSGDDDLTLTMMTDSVVKCAGVISVLTNLFPGPIIKMVEKQQAGDASGAKDIEAKLSPVFKLVGCAVSSERILPDDRRIIVQDNYPNPVPVKTMMAALGMPTGTCRAPIGLMEASAVSICREALKKVHAEAPEFFAPVAEAFELDPAARLNDDAAWSAVTR